MPGDIEIKRVGCFFCHMNCGLLAYVQDGKIVRLIDDAERQTRICERVGRNGEFAIKFHYHPDRVNYALKRKGKRGENKWEKIPYDQALDEIAEKLKDLKAKFGPETLCVTEGTYRSDQKWARSRFLNLFGNPQNSVGPGNICWTWIYVMNMALCGWQCEVGAPPTMTKSRCIVVWGKDPHESYSPKAPVWRHMSAALKQEKPPKIIVVDPVATDIVRYSDMWLEVRPGTDAAMELAWANVIINEDLYDREFIETWTNAPFLVRMDIHKILREADVVNGGSRDNFIIWDTEAKKPAVWLSKSVEYREKVGKLALAGEYDVAMADGKKVKCKTVWTLLKELVDQYPPEKVAEITWVPAHKIREAARIYATNRPGTILWGVGGGDMVGRNATSCAFVRTILRALTGNLDIVGGEYLAGPGPYVDGKMVVRDCELELADRCLPETRKKAIGNDFTRLMCWPGYELTAKPYEEVWKLPRPLLNQLSPTAPLIWRAMLTGEPYPVRAMIAWGSNPMLWAANTKLVYEALKSLDLLIDVEYWMTPTAQLADYVMPAADWMERPLLTTIEDASDVAVGGVRAVLPEHDRRTDYDFFRGLGMRLGQENDWPWETNEEMISYRIERIGMTYDEFARRPWILGNLNFEKHKDIIPETGKLHGFATPSRRVEIYSSIFEELDYDPLPKYEEPVESPVSDPELAKEYPLMLITGGRFVPMFHSEHRVPGIGTREMWPWPTMLIHPDTARDLGIRDGDWCWIETKRGRIRQKAKLSFTIDPQVINIQASWWYPEMPGEEPFLHGVWESNANVLTLDDPETLDPLCGNWTTRGLLCKVYPSGEPK